MGSKLRIIINGVLEGRLRWLEGDLVILLWEERIFECQVLGLDYRGGGRVNGVGVYGFGCYV